MSAIHLDRPTPAASCPTAPPSTRASRVVVDIRSPRAVGLVKASIGVPMTITADVFADGHDAVAACVLITTPGRLVQLDMAATPDGGVSVDWVPDALGPYEVVVRGWIDEWSTWEHAVRARLSAGADVTVDLLDGARLLAAIELIDDHDAKVLELARQVLECEDRDAMSRFEAAGHLAGEAPSRPRAGQDAAASEPVAVIVEPRIARTSAWYELFPRSLGDDGRHGTLRDVHRAVEAVADLGFDVLYLPPIHPIGSTNRKGPNNSLASMPGDPGSPWAIGDATGGHDAVHPELGTVTDVAALVTHARHHGVEIALDLALQCSPDHPWVHDHPEWFRHRADGSIRSAENPPKRYEDIYPLDFSGPAWRELWAAVLDVVLHWMRIGVRVFRVDNPHTKPFALWQWLLDAARSEDPSVVFLAEAFTRPQVMEYLGAIGFSQSYTYFTWRTDGVELREYFEHLTTELADVMRPNVWPNTPDILAEQLALQGPSAFALRALLASTLAANWGIYGPAFEFAENQPVRPGSEEYLDSEKYQLRTRGSIGSGPLSPLLRRLNAARRSHAALQQDRGLRFHDTDHPDRLLCYSKSEPSGDRVLVVVNLDPTERIDGWVHLDLDAIDLDDDATFIVHDLLDGERYRWQGVHNFVALDPATRPGHLFEILPISVQD